MLITILSWIYNTSLCFCWGDLFFKQLKPEKSFAEKNGTFFFIQCFTGMAAIASLLTVTTFFTHLYNPILHLLFIIPVITYIIQQKPITISRSIKEWYNGLLKPLKWLLLTMLLLILIMSIYEVTHPDTIRYHAQIVRWLGYYKITPGIVHFDQHLGLQSNWFTVCSFFSFPFAGVKALTFINTTLLTWFFGFIVSKLNHYIKNGYQQYYTYIVLLIIFLALALLNYTLVRLTATSLSSDFPAALFVLLIGYLFLQSPVATGNQIHIVFLCCFAYTIKPSTLPILLLIPLLMYMAKNKKALFLYGFLCFIIVLVPFFIRNVISTGHLLYPFAIKGMPFFDWSFEIEKCNAFRNYILGYARVYDEAPTHTAAILQLPFTKWIQIWWQHQSAGNKLLILSLVLSMFLLLTATLKGKKTTYHQRSILVISLAGLIFWFTNAPDPRFGMGFILLFQALAYCIAFEHFSLPSFFIGSKHIRLWVYSLSIVLFLYSTYRFTYYFAIKDFVQPAGIRSSTSAIPTAIKNGIVVNAVSPQTNCGDVKPPCLSGAAYPLEARGTRIEDGFRSKRK